MLQVGDNLAGYDIVAKLNSGGMASLFLGRRARTAGFAKYVAIKVVHSHLANDQSFIHMFLDEARLSARIDHPNVVHVEDLGEHNGDYFMVMEYIAGVSLQQLVRALAKKKLRMVPEVAVAIAMRLASGLHAAHELTDNVGTNLGVMHRDVSPQNVILAFKGHVKLIDFGIAKASDRAQHTRTAAFKGKTRYSAPEQAMGKAIDRRADIFALGILLWEMLTSERLFDGDSDFAVLRQVCEKIVDSPSVYAPGVSKAVDAVVLKALAKDASQRPQTAEEFRQQMLAALPGAASISPEQIADLLAAFAQDSIDAEARKLGDVSSVIQIMGLNSKSLNFNDVANSMVVSSTAKRLSSHPPPTQILKPNVEAVAQEVRNLAKLRPASRSSESGTMVGPSLSPSARLTVSKNDLKSKGWSSKHWIALAVFLTLLAAIPFVWRLVSKKTEPHSDQASAPTSAELPTPNSRSAEAATSPTANVETAAAQTPSGQTPNAESAVPENGPSESADMVFELDEVEAATGTERRREPNQGTASARNRTKRPSESGGPSKVMRNAAGPVSTQFE